MNEIINSSPSSSSSISTSLLSLLTNDNNSRAEKILQETLQTKSDILFLKHKKKLLLEEMYRQYIEGEIEPRKRIRRITKLEEDLGNEIDPTKGIKNNGINLKEKIIISTSPNNTEINTVNDDFNKEDISNENNNNSSNNNNNNNIIKNDKKGKKTDVEKESDKESQKQLKEAKEMEKQTIKIDKEAEKEATKLSKEIKKKTTKDSVVVYQSDVITETESKV
jgi:hypothetical protein